MKKMYGIFKVDECFVSNEKLEIRFVQKGFISEIQAERALPGIDHKQIVSGKTYMILPYWEKVKNDTSEKQSA